MAIAGIEGLAQGLIQGMALKRQNDRQELLDARDTERFGMDKERFATQQAASAFELQNAQTNAANAAMDRTRNLRIQADQDAFDVKMKRLLSTGDDNLATLAEVEKVHLEDGVKGAFQRDPKTGVILTDAKGFATWINADGSPPQKHTGDSARKLFFAKQYPKDAMTLAITNADTIASENRKEKTTIAAEVRAAKTAKEKDERDYQQAISLENVRARNAITELERKGALKVPKDYLSKLSQQSFFEVQETIDPTTKEKKLSKPIFNQAKYDQFTLFAHQNNINPDDTAYRLWRKYVNEGSPQAATTTSNTETYKSKSQGDLTVTGGLDKQSAEVSMDGVAKVSVEKPSAVKSSTSKPSTPKALTIPKPSASSGTPAKVYHGNAGMMSATELAQYVDEKIPRFEPVKRKYSANEKFFGNETSPFDNNLRLGNK